MDQISDSTTWTSLVRSITIYADDILSQRCFHSEEEFVEHLKHCGILLDVLEDIGLQVNISKSYAMITVAGIRHRRTQSKFIQRTAQGWWICIPRRNGNSSKVLLKDQLPYLGIQLSYKCFEASTLEVRVAAGRQAFRRLRKWFLSKRQLTFPQKLALWNSVVRTTLTYGLAATGLTPGGLRRLVKLMTMQQRTIADNHSYVTRTTHADFFADHSILPPAADLRRCCEQILQGHQRRLHVLAPTDLLRSLKLANDRELFVSH